MKKGELEKLHQLFTRDDHCTAMLKKEPLDEEEDAVGGCIEKFDRLDISGGIDDIANEDLFDEEVVDEGNIFNWGGLWLLYNTIWYYTILYHAVRAGSNYTKQ